jgi:hypothetical protein
VLKLRCQEPVRESGPEHSKRPILQNGSGTSGLPGITVCMNPIRLHTHVEVCPLIKRSVEPERWCYDGRQEGPTKISLIQMRGQQFRSALGTFEQNDIWRAYLLGYGAFESV